MPAKAANTDLASVFGGGAATEADVDMEAEALPELEGELATDDAPEAIPPDFAVHAMEAFPDMDDARVDALYRAIKSCHGGM